MAFEDWLEKRRHVIDPVPLPAGSKPPYYATGEIITTLRKELEAIGWPQRDAYGDYIAPDGRPVKIAYCRKDIKAETPGTLFVVYGQRRFQSEREKLIEEEAPANGWLVVPLPERTQGGRSE